MKGTKFCFLNILYFGPIERINYYFPDNNNLINISQYYTDLLNAPI